MGRPQVNTSTIFERAWYGSLAATNLVGRRSAMGRKSFFQRNSRRSLTLAIMLPTISLSIFGCQEDRTEPQETNAASPVASQPQPGNEQAPVETETTQQTVDLELVSMELPSQAARDKDFPIMVTIHNNSDIEVLAANFKARASIDTPTSSMNLPAGDGKMRQISPRETRRAEIMVHAPHVPGIANISITVEPFPATDPNPTNNQRMGRIVVN